IFLKSLPSPILDLVFFPLTGSLDRKMDQLDSKYSPTLSHSLIFLEETFQNLHSHVGHHLDFDSVLPVVHRSPLPHDGFVVFHSQTVSLTLAFQSQLDVENIYFYVDVSFSLLFILLPV